MNDGSVVAWMLLQFAMRLTFKYSWDISPATEDVRVGTVIIAATSVLGFSTVVATDRIG